MNLSCQFFIMPDFLPQFLSHIPPEKWSRQDAETNVMFGSHMKKDRETLKYRISTTRGYVKLSHGICITFHNRFEAPWWKWRPTHSTIAVMYPSVHPKHNYRASCVKAMKPSEISDMWNANCSPLMSTVFTWLI